jgi:hypothetical protein
MDTEMLQGTTIEGRNASASIIRIVSESRRAPFYGNTEECQSFGRAVGQEPAAGGAQEYAK